MRAVAIGPGCRADKDDQTVLAVNDEVYFQIDRWGDGPPRVWVRVPAKGGLILANGDAVTTDEVWDMFEEFGKAAREEEKRLRSFAR